MGIATDQFTPIFAMSRVAGWAAHVLEQHGNNRLIRPRAEYTGATRATYVPSRSAERGQSVSPIPFAKGHGLGNDYIVMSRQDLPFDLSEASIVRICDRNWGIGSTGSSC
jgi:hypothetical protein